MPIESPLVRADGLDSPGVRIAAAAGSAYELFLSRALTRAAIVSCSNPDEAFDRFVSEGLEALAGIKPSLQRIAQNSQGYRLLEGSFLAIDQGVAVRRDKNAAIGFVDEILAEMFPVGS